MFGEFWLFMLTYPVLVQSMQIMGNSKGRAVYEANVPDDYRNHE